MRPGEIVRSGARITTFEKLPTDCDGEPWAGCRIVTVAELFAAAGHPVPEGDFPLLYDDVDDNWYRPDFVWFDGDKWVVDDGIADRAKSPDLSRLPALDAWDALPQIVKAVVK